MREKDEEINSLFSFYKVNKKKISDDLEQFVNNKLKDITVSDDAKPTPSAAFERVLKGLHSTYKAQEREKLKH